MFTVITSHGKVAEVDGICAFLRGKSKNVENYAVVYHLLPVSDDARKRKALKMETEYSIIGS